MFEVSGPDAEAVHRVGRAKLRAFVCQGDIARRLLAPRPLKEMGALKAGLKDIVAQLESEGEYSSRGGNGSSDIQRGSRFWDHLTALFEPDKKGKQLVGGTSEWASHVCGLLIVQSRSSVRGSGSISTACSHTCTHRLYHLE